MLEEIVSDVRQGIPALRQREPQIRSAAERAPAARDFRGALTAPGLSVIAEFKRASPSRGIIDADLDPAVQANRYEAGGAAALSVLTEPDHFAGRVEDLADVPVKLVSVGPERASTFEVPA